MELSKYIEALKAALAANLSFPAVATVDAIMSPEGNLHGGNIAVAGERFSLGSLFSPIASAEGVHVRFQINVA